jgi:hypothetical protein
MSCGCLLQVDTLALGVMEACEQEARLEAPPEVKGMFVSSLLVPLGMARTEPHLSAGKAGDKDGIVEPSKKKSRVSFMQKVRDYSGATAPLLRLLSRLCRWLATRTRRW